jgi:gamma-glutamyltranspeptidase/glutathione hydrolase
VETYDGRETAPAAATENYLRWISDEEQTSPLPNARASGRSIGTPGTVRVLDLAHKDHGRKPWKDLFKPAIELATDGFAISGRMADAIAGARNNLLRDPEAVAYFLNPDLTPKGLGTIIRNPDYAETLRIIAEQGADAFYTGPIAQSIVDKIRVTEGGPDAPGPITPGLTTLEDLANYRPIKRDPVCTTYRDWWVCGMGPPSSGGIAVAQALGILENFDLRQFGPTGVDLEGGRPSVMGVHLVSEAERLAYADRNRYVADTDFVPLPGNGVSSMLDKDYLRSRAGLIRFDRSMGVAEPGTFPGTSPAGISTNEGKGTTHVSIVDRWGNAVSMTTTIESGMGSFHFTRGFLLNNELTDFSAAPSDANGPIANRVEPLKRPRSSMAPTIVFRKAADGGIGDLHMITGSPGGAAIIQYVTKTLVAALDWGLDAQQATNMMHFGSANTATTNLGGEHPNLNTANNGEDDPLVTGLRSLGHTVTLSAQSSGISTILRVTENGRTRWEGGADPRREGIVLGDKD